ncbi:MAG: UDP-N-acetylglucosamine 2-epimerase (non-hydrolyzing) [Pseudomonadota bacterium]
MKIHLVCAARPNFMKIAPLYHALKKERWATPVLVHTGQHYDVNMSDAFFRDLALPEPDIHLGVGSGTHAEQTGNVMTAYEKALIRDRPDLVVVAGDVNSTMAATLAATKLGIKVGHLEAGLRSYDRTMPEEINRIVTDVLADILWIPSPDAEENLIKEGIPQDRICFVGNIMIDSLEILKEPIQKRATCAAFGLTKNTFGVVTLHRPANVDDARILSQVTATLIRISEQIPLVFPIHPRTRASLDRFGLLDAIQAADGVLSPEPLGYIDFMNLVSNARLVITDSGGIQEETSYLGIPCLTLRPNTERPITTTMGSNQLCSLEDLEKKVLAILAEKRPPRRRIKYWDGKTAGRIVTHLKRLKTAAVLPG